MKWYILTGENGYVYASSPNPDLEGCMEVEVPSDFDVCKQHEYRLLGHELFHDPLPEPEPAVDPVQQRLDEYETALLELAEMIAGGGK